MSEVIVLDLSRKDLNAEDFRQILIGLSSPYRREQRPRKCKPQRRGVGLVATILANLPTNVSNLNVSRNTGIGDAGMMHLHLISDTVKYLNLSGCGLTPVGIKKVCEFLKTNSSITTMVMAGNQMEAEGYKDVADMMKVNNAVIAIFIGSRDISSAADFCHLSDGLAQNTGLWCTLCMGLEDGLTDEHVQNLCPGLALNKGLETLELYSLDQTITETGVGYLEQVLQTNVHLKYIRGIADSEDIPTGPGTIWNKLKYWLGLNQCNRKLLQDPSSTPKQWRDAIIDSSEAGNHDAIFWFLKNKPELFMR
jgi:hypothetical protein